MGLSVGNYQATLTIEGFKGVMQFDENESINTDMKYAADARNFDTRDGSLLPIISVKQVEQSLPEQGFIRSAAILRLPDEAPYDLLVIWHAWNMSMTSFLKPYEGQWPVHTLSTQNGSNYWSGVQYDRRITSEQATQVVVGDQGFYTGSSKDPLRVVYIIANKDTPYTPQNYVSLGISTPNSWKFGVLAYHGERIWGAAIEGEPDVVCYSAPYDPTDWAENVQIPEDGGGEIRIPSFDGERITALQAFGATLLVFKEKHLYRITGLSPDEYTVQEQYGGGTIFPNTVALYQDRVFFLTTNGVCVYDGVSVRPYQQYALRTLWRNVNILGAISDDANLSLYSPHGVVFDDKYILSFIGADQKYHTVVYNFVENSWSHLISDEVGVGLRADVFLPYEDGLYVFQHLENNSALYRWYGSIEKVPEYEINKPDTFEGFDWLTPWSDMGAKDILKNEFKLRFWIQTHMASGDRLKLAVTVETERGSKTREIIFDRDVDEEIKMRFHLSGRKVRMRFTLTDREGNEQIASWCKILGGVQLNADTSPD